MNKHPRLTPEESEILLSSMRQKGITQVKLAKEIHIQQSALSRILRGKRPMPKQYVNLIYRTLGIEVRPESFIPESSSLVSPVGRHWNALYQAFERQLRGIYDTTNSAQVKGSIIGDLEKLVEKYKQ